jgi:sulfate/thiosulfate transport system ATP-binding protein
MAVADQVAVMSEGRIEQVGSPREVYEQPANEFVMTFVGQAHQLGDTFVRPHDLEVTLEPNGSTREVMIDRIVHLGFNVRLDLVDSEGERLSVQTTRDHAELLEIAAGQIVYVRPTRHTTFA